MTKMLSASDGLRPLAPRPGALPLDPAGGSAPDPRYKLVLRTRDGAPQQLTPSTAYNWYTQLVDTHSFAYTDITYSFIFYIQNPQISMY